jgi:D-glycero-D-manno-heptose 1,7-bisphosphate phosphatase
MGRRAIIMDRDGTLCEEVGYVNHVSRIRVPERSVRAVRLANEAGFQTVVVTNQAGVARGYFEEALILDVHDRIREVLADGGARLDGMYYCPHHPSAGEAPYRRDCDCRKPGPGMLLRASREMGIDLRRSYMVGDSPKDIEAGRAAGATTILLRTGYGRGEIEHRSDRWSVRPDHVAEDLLEAVEWILERERPSAVGPGTGPADTPP